METKDRAETSAGLTRLGCIFTAKWPHNLRLPRRVRHTKPSRATRETVRYRKPRVGGGRQDGCKRTSRRLWANTAESRLEMLPAAPGSSPAQSSASDRKCRLNPRSKALELAIDPRHGVMSDGFVGTSRARPTSWRRPSPATHSRRRTPPARRMAPQQKRSLSAGLPDSTTTSSTSALRPVLRLILCP